MLSIIAVIAMSIISVCLVIATFSLAAIRHGHMAVLAALNGVGETYRLGFEAVTTDLNRLEARVRKLEDQ